VLIVIFGESCTGKTTLAQSLQERLGPEVWNGKDFLRLARSGGEAERLFREKLDSAVEGEDLIYVLAEKELLGLVPEGAVRVLVTADLETIKARFAKRTGGTLPPPVAAMLERRHGCFDNEPHDLHVISGESDMEEIIRRIAGK